MGTRSSSRCLKPRALSTGALSTVARWTRAHRTKDCLDDDAIVGVSSAAGAAASWRWCRQLDLGQVHYDCQYFR